MSSSDESQNMFKVPRPSPLNIDYLFYMEVSKISGMISPTRTLLPHSKNWTKIIPVAVLEPLVIDIVSLTWPKFQEQVLTHLKSGDPTHDVYQLILDLHDKRRIKWVASITNHKDRVVRAEIGGAADWVSFSNAAYENYPGCTDLELVMENPSCAAGDKCQCPLS
ncbi:hypothetical protein PTTG_27567 [Puccinia triticina 1-1 BBBD Race 1]|uniref:Uncharacterized protein n=1 Tax=Puccinia triticina (isolate 1-1 / race 1 (BBBD)) TaxID=630390 RepID=A0A180GJI0_PUCT1|nr:hypothetical protein PTTG_27567 [Puccinia triticina 1-1 BBBD Race 1]